MGGRGDQGISHHTETAASRVSPTIAALVPAEAADLPEVEVRIRGDVPDPTETLGVKRTLRVTTMGRSIDDDPLFRAAAGRRCPGGRSDGAVKPLCPPAGEQLRDRCPVETLKYTPR